ncbi:His-Xaa-Ser repeat protein HxsA [compost metagenome]
MNFVDKALPLSRQGLAEALDRLELASGQTAALWAVFEVETSGITQGFGFRADRRPQILFERHKFRDATGGRFNASDPDISGPQGGYGGLATQYPKLERALALCKKANLGVEPALRSASWGLGQVMGFNYQLAGFASAEEMVKAMVRSEDAQLMGMVGYLGGTGLTRHLKNQNWEAFARGYNGKSYAQNHYHIKLEEQYARFSSGSMPNIEVRTAQAALLVLGFAPGKIDGVMGQRTKGALSNFQLGHGLSASGDLDSATFEKLVAVAFG